MTHPSDPTTLKAWAKGIAITIASWTLGLFLVAIFMTALSRCIG